MAMKPILHVLSAIENALGWLAASAMLAIMVVVFCDVVLRYAFNSPLSWAYDLISLYLVAAVFFLSVSSAYGEGAHVNVDILQQALPAVARRVTELVIACVGVTVFSLIAWFGAERTSEAYLGHDVISGAIAWPTWPAQALVPLGCGLMALRLAIHVIGHLASLVSGKSLIPISVGHGDDRESFE
jgi:TRAP-type C4-dicarboxylate transport system permease small subunit